MHHQTMVDVRWDISAGPVFLGMLGAKLLNKYINLAIDILAGGLYSGRLILKTPVTAIVRSIMPVKNRHRAL